MSFSALTGATVVSASPWKTISGTPATGQAMPPFCIAANAEGRSFAARYPRPQCTPAAAYRSGYVAAMTAAMAPPADSPAT